MANGFYQNVDKINLVFRDQVQLVENEGSAEDDFEYLHSPLPSEIAQDAGLAKVPFHKFLATVKRVSTYVYSSDKYRQVDSPTSIQPSSPITSSVRGSTVDSFRLFSAEPSAYLRRLAIRHKNLQEQACEKVIKRPDSKFRKFLRKITLWNNDLEQIRSYFGKAAAGYFKLVRFLFVVNIASILFLFLLMIWPFLAFSTSPDLSLNEKLDCHAKMKHLSWVMCNDSRVDLYLKCSKAFRDDVHKAQSEGFWLFHVFNVMRGQGPLTLSPLYYAYYSDVLTNGITIIPAGLFYCSVIGIVFLGTFISLLYYSYKSVIKNGSPRNLDFHFTFSNMAFDGWDHTITSGEGAVNMRHVTNRRYLKMQLEREARKKFTQSLAGFDCFKIYLMRIIIMLLSLLLIAVGVILILLAAAGTQKQLDDNGDDAATWYQAFSADYMPATVVVILNTFLPDVFVAFSKAEKYSPDFEVKLILFRLILSRFCIVVTYMVPLFGFQFRELFSWSSKNTTEADTASNSTTAPLDFSQCAAIELERNIGQKSYCWEANVGEQLFKIVAADLVTFLLLTFVYSAIRRVLVEKVQKPRKLAAILRKVGRREFELPVEVINLFYIQTITWIALYFMPVLPLITGATRFLLFYVKKWDLFANTYLIWRVRAADFVQSFYMAYLCGCFIVSLSFIGYATSVLPTSPGCGPFALANNYSALEMVFDEIRATSAVTGEVAELLGHPLVAGSFVTVICFVAICFHLYGLSTKRRVTAIQQLIRSEMSIRDYYFKRYHSNVAGNTNGVTSSVGSTLPRDLGNELRIRANNAATAALSSNSSLATIPQTATQQTILDDTLNDDSASTQF